MSESMRILRHWTSDVDAALDAAKERLDTAVEALEERGLDTRGAIGDADPLLAVNDALVDFDADQIVVSTHPEGRSNWLGKDLVERVRGQFAVPVVHVISSYGAKEAEPA